MDPEQISCPYCHREHPTPVNRRTARIIALEPLAYLRKTRRHYMALRAIEHDAPYEEVARAITLVSQAARAWSRMFDVAVSYCERTRQVSA